MSPTQGPDGRTARFETAILCAGQLPWHVHKPQSGDEMRASIIWLVAAAILSGCGPTPEQKAAAEAEAKKAEAARLKVEAEAAREKEEAPIKKAAMEAVSERLLDPSSAQFRNVVVKRMSIPETADRYSYTRVSVCGEVNAKNTYGGYVGFLPFGYLVSLEIAGKPQKNSGERLPILIGEGTPKQFVEIYEDWC